ncbi:Protein vip1 [Tieghemiomyces parasiticus]|uniref:Protein vip1 n=1 Tax=Tieghemiomyces parasiticus TaxID=78921 RepID=A0A9W8DI13_9FUNG|nr:Protein vip1 [Tieghemiomyces parasiticus]
MSLNTWSSVKIPAEPTRSFVLVEGIAPEADETKVREFFTFCGKINQFELRPAGTSSSVLAAAGAPQPSQEALIEFDHDSAAKTAVLLSNAMIAEQPINVKYLFEEFNAASPTVTTTTAAEEGVDAEKHKRSLDEASDLLRSQGTALPQEDKPKSTVFHEIVARGYLLSERLLSSAYDYDRRYGLTEKAQNLLGQARTQAAAIDERLGVSTKVRAVEEKYHIQEKVNNLTSQATALSSQALETPTGQRVVSAFNQVKDTGSKTYADGVRLAEEKKRQASVDDATSGEPAAATVVGEGHQNNPTAVPTSMPTAADQQGH